MLAVAAHDRNVQDGDGDLSRISASPHAMPAQHREPPVKHAEIGWQVAPALWGHGYGAEAGHAVAHQAFTNVGVSEVFAVVRPGNHRGVATARRVGMEWVGETDKYYNLTLEIYRLSKADLDLPEPACAPAPGSH